MSKQLVESIRQIWADVADPKERAFRITNHVAATLNSTHAPRIPWGVFEKSGGQGFTYKGRHYSLDLIFNRDDEEGFDVLYDAETTAVPVWNKKTITKMEDWHAAWRPPIMELLPNVQPIPNPPQPGDPLAQLREEIAQIKKELADLKQKPDTNLDEILNAVVSKIRVSTAKTGDAGPAFLRHSHGVNPLRLERF